MVLTDTQAEQYINTPAAKLNLTAIETYESKLRVFTEELDNIEIQEEEYFSQGFLQTMINRSSAKTKRVLDFARYPLPTTEITESILEEFYRIYDGKNRFFDVNSNVEIPRLKDWLENNDIIKWIEQSTRKAFKNNPNTYVVIDVLDNVPYLILVDTKRLVDLQFKKDNSTLEYIIFIHSQQKDTNGDIVTTNYAVYDDENYYVFE